LDVEFKAGEREVEDAAEVNPEERAAVEAAAEAAAAAAKPKRKKEAAPVAAITEVPVIDPTAIQFAVKLENEYAGFNNVAPTAFRIIGKQIPAPDGTVYPELGVAANGSIDAGKQTWPTVEHYYQAMKFPVDPAWQEEIRLAPSTTKAKQMGADAAHPARGDWGQIKDAVMKTALLAKFQQNPPLLATLQSTGDRPLVDLSTGDPYWSAGPKGRGRNRLGTLLAEVRTALKDVRPDQSLLATGIAAEVVAGAKEDEVVAAAASPDAAVAVAKESVAAATGGVVSLEPAPTGQQGGVYLFVNPDFGGGGEHKARRGRDRGRGRNLSWEGMAVSKMGSESEGGQSGGGSNGVEEMTTDSGASLEVSVEKLGQ
jgi:hypothetical protein